MKVFHIIGDDTLKRGIYSVSQGELIDWGARYSNIPCAISKDNSNYIYVYMDKAITNEDKLYNSNVNELLDNSVTNIYNKDKNEKYEPLEVPENYNTSNFNINGTYSNRVAMAESEGYGTSYDVYIFNYGIVEHTEDMTTYKGTYTIKDSKITITYTGAYDIEDPIPLDKFNDELTIKNENTLVTADGIEFLKE